MHTFKLGQGSIILRVKLLNSSVTTGAGLTGLTSASGSLLISTLASNEATPTVYAQGSSNIETIATLGTFAAPTASKCRFKEVDATNHPGLYEIQIADARWAVSGAKNLIVSISGATNLAQQDVLIPLTSFDPFDAVRAGLTALPNAVAAAAGGLITRGTGTGQLNVNGGRADANLLYRAGAAIVTGTALSGSASTIGLPAGFTSNDVAPGDTVETLGGATARGVSGIVLSIAGSGTSTPVATIFGTWNGSPPAAGTDFIVHKEAGGQIPADITSLPTAAAVAAILAKLPSVAAGAVGGLAVLDANLRLPSSVTAMSNGVIDSILTRTIAEPTGPFLWNAASLATIMGYLGALARNKTITSESGVTVRNSTDTSNISSASLSLVSGVLTRGAYA